MGQREEFPVRRTRTRPKILERVNVLMPSVPISFYHDDVPRDGWLLRFMSPEIGTISKVTIMVENIPDATGDIQIIVTGINRQTTVEHKFPLKKGENVIDLTAAVQRGTRISVQLTKLDGTPLVVGEATGIWISAVYKPDITGNIQPAVERQ